MKTFFDRVTMDIEITRNCLRLTGSVHGTRKHVAEYLEQFDAYSWLWKSDPAKAYREFMNTKPDILDFEHKLQEFESLKSQINSHAPMHDIGCLCLNTNGVRQSLCAYLDKWKVLFADKLRLDTKDEMETECFDFIGKIMCYS